MITISLCMIVKNEERVLKRCLDSVRDLVDEIIIVDTGSTDATKRIAAGYTDKIYDLTWNDDFSAARNFAFSKATKEYIYSADADEVLSEENRRRFRLLKETLLPEIDTTELELRDNWIWAGKEQAISLAALAEESYYSLTNSSVLTAEVSEQVKKNTIATGCCFAEVEVDMKLGKIKVLHIINVHDSGKLLNPQLAEMQVHGGISMGMGYGISEQLILDEKTGRPLNGNLLDYKLMTMLDTPELKADFVELDDPIGPYGNKALGEPPAIPCAPAIRNAVLHATGVAFNENPLTPQRLIDGFQKAGLI